MLLHQKLKQQGVRLILASQSPRRKQIIGDCGLEAETIKYDVDESYPLALKAADVPLYLAKLKADNYPHELHPNEVVITADTVVISRGEILGKPRSLDHAREMLSRLSGEEHLVVTGVSLRSHTKQHGFSVTTKVRFAQLTSEQIDYYVNTYSPLDKAGSYGIQEWIGYVGIESIEGSFYNVMGLPIHVLCCELERFIK